MCPPAAIAPVPSRKASPLVLFSCCQAYFGIDPFYFAAEALQVAGGGVEGKGDFAGDVRCAVAHPSHTGGSWASPPPHAPSAPSCSSKIGSPKAVAED